MVPDNRATVTPANVCANGTPTILAGVDVSEIQRENSIAVRPARVSKLEITFPKSVPDKEISVDPVAGALVAGSAMRGESDVKILDAELQVGRMDPTKTLLPSNPNACFDISDVVDAQTLLSEPEPRSLAFTLWPALPWKLRPTMVVITAPEEG